ncbi:lycopene cyclase family protein [Robiginitalea sp. M366]|uniref:lycopene cyclase family protein n=1 Tax=Robiginitalea aestuariiviva TaxID=3036903 RepID=UPI00240D664F|nr:lycopene cyclase family protein [Robiginitalea aestuariiviva]MDG1571293.1 lycopene cyclase family protein [Robiginitalea aestuariiviva]
MQHFDYIIIGAGASGLLLADAMGQDPWFAGKRIALLEQNPAKGNDRTWCFWERGAGVFDPLLHQSWNAMQVAGPGFRRTSSLHPFRYKMLRSAAFYAAYGKRLDTYPHITRITSTVTALEEADGMARVTTPEHTYTAGHVFSSVLLQDRDQLMQPYPVLQQHFTGWFIRSENPVFDPEAPTFMDFDLPQNGNTRFMYILPTSPTEGLVEYTLFSKDLLAPEAYEAALRDYIDQRLGSQGYEILESEHGSIPMTSNDFTRANSAHITHIGIAGGWAKPSTGYTFWNAVRNTPKVIRALKAGKNPEIRQPWRFWMYDRLLLDALARENGKGGHIFSSQLRRLPIPLLLTFLNEETHLLQEARVIATSPKGPFLRAAFRALFRSRA